MSNGYPPLKSSTAIGFVVKVKVASTHTFSTAARTHPSKWGSAAYSRR
jgi:hypothetical protein